MEPLKIFLICFVAVTTSLFAAEVRILSLCTAASDILIRTGQKDKLKAIDLYGQIVPGTEDIPVIGRGATVSLEKITAMGITHVIIWDYQSEMERVLPNLTIIKLPPVRIANYGEVVRTLCKLTGAEEAGEELITEFRKLTALPENSSAKKPKVYVELYSRFKTGGRDSYINDLVTLAGGENIALQVTESGTINAEYVVAQAPDVIIFVENFTVVADMQRRPGFSEVPAVKNNRIYSVSRKIFIAGLDPADAVRTLRKLIQGTE